MRLTKRQREILQHLADYENDPHEGNITCDGLECWVGDNRTNWQTVMFFLTHCLISPQNGGGCEHFGINPSGKAALKDPDYESPLKDVLMGRPRYHS